MSQSKGLQKLDEFPTIVRRRRRPLSFVPVAQGPKSKKVKYHIDLTYSDSEWFFFTFYLTLSNHLQIL